jgi:hypothetical protein
VKSAFTSFPEDREKVHKSCEDQLRKHKDLILRRSPSEVARSIMVEEDDDVILEEIPPHPGNHRSRWSNQSHSQTSSPARKVLNSSTSDAKLSLLPNFSSNEETGSIHFRSARMSNSSLNRTSPSPSDPIKVGQSNPMLASSPLKGHSREFRRESIKRTPIASVDELSQLKVNNRQERNSILKESASESLDEIKGFTGDDAV